MKLVSAHVRMFRSILDSDPVAIGPKVTCLVGKNESGKSSFLEALHRLDPARANVTFSIPDHYPAWLEKQHVDEERDLDKFVPIRVVFELEAIDKVSLEKIFGPNVFSKNQLELGRSYDNTLDYTNGMPFNEQAAVIHVANSIKSKKNIQKEIADITTFEELRQVAADLKAQGPTHPLKTAAGAELEAAINSALPNKSFYDIAFTLLYKRIPHFFYFAEYAKLPYSAKLQDVLTSDAKHLTDEQLTARSFLRLGGADDDYLLNPDYERRKRELENVSNRLTHDVEQYWSTNQDLRVQPDITQVTEQKSNGLHAVLDELKIRVWDDRHGLSLPFNQHSTGFQWFFSFLAAFSEFQNKNPPVIILLDEPGLGLHAKAQKDFLRFIDDRLSKKCQVIYSTHSPFMIQPSELDRVRVVEDKGKDLGTKISQDIFTTDPDTLFPLQSALGYDLAQHLFIGPNNLVLEGTSDLTYISVISDHLASLSGRTALDAKWSFVPVGGADMVPTFVALLGHHLDVTVVIDARKSGNQRLTHLVTEGFLSRNRLITIGDIVKQPHADIEDLFTVEDYLTIYNSTFGTPHVTKDQLEGNDQIVNQIARRLKVERFDHGRPADVFLRQRTDFLPKLSADTLSNFETLFTRINATLKSQDA